MITAGIDMGAKTIKVVVLRDGVVVGKAMAVAGFESQDAAQRAYSKRDISEVASGARGVIKLYPSARTVIDVGAEEGRAIRCTEEGKVLDFALNEKCAAGAGAFTEAMSRALEVGIEALGPMSLNSKNAIPMNAQCAVFAESEVVSLLHAKTPKEDIARAVHDAIASRIVFEPDVVLIGGVAYNVGFVDSLERALECDVIVPDDPEYVGAYGAALAAAEA
jgi:predicted CoA-substrate-specific enzyme activase